MTTQLIMFEGLYGAGKSTTSQYVANQLNLNATPTLWLDEYQLLIQFFESFFVGFRQGDKGTGELLVSSWEKLSESLTKVEEDIVILDGPFLTNNIVRMLSVNHNLEDIYRYSIQTQSLLSPYGNLLSIDAPSCQHCVVGTANDLRVFWNFQDAWPSLRRCEPQGPPAAPHTSVIWRTLI